MATIFKGAKSTTIYHNYNKKRTGFNSYLGFVTQQRLKLKPELEFLNEIPQRDLCKFYINLKVSSFYQF